MAFLRFFLATLLVVPAATSASAEDVTLASPSGLTVDGRLLEYDGEFFRIETEDGSLTLLAVGMTCSGSSCPVGASESLAIDVGEASTTRLAVGLLRAFAEERGWSLVEEHSPAGVEQVVIESGDTRVAVRLGREPGAWRILRDPRSRPPHGWRDVALGFDGLVPAVSIENPVTSLTLLGLRSALAGEFGDWEGLGGVAGTPVKVHWVPSLEGPVLDAFGISAGDDATRFEDSRDAADAIAREPGGLGILPLGDLGAVAPLVVSGPCGRGVLAVPAAIRSGDYPFSETIVLRVPAGRPGPVARDFRSWIESAGIADEVRSAGFVDLEVREVSPGWDGRQNVDISATGSLNEASALDGARRLDVSMRFEGGSSLPDRSAAVQIARLARAIAAGDFDGARLVFAGFSDADGSQPVNLALSKRRAEAIRDAVADRIADADRDVDMVAMGFGEAMPIACNGSDWGESLNRRVEVWVVDGA